MVGEVIIIMPFKAKKIDIKLVRRVRVLDIKIPFGSGLVLRCDHPVLLFVLQPRLSFG